MEVDYDDTDLEQSDSSDSAMPAEVIIPRKITLFRVMMERRLGIDWEHSDHSSEIYKSLQTN